MTSMELEAYKAELACEILTTDIIPLMDLIIPCGTLKYLIADPQCNLGLISGSWPKDTSIVALIISIPVLNGTK